MAIYEIKCNKCKHKFYDISVLCNKEELDDTCPACESKDISQEIMVKPVDKVWAEEEGCYHEDLDTEKLMTQKTSGCGSCAHKTNTKSISIDEEIDLRIKENKTKIRNYKMPEKLESQLKEPWGEVVSRVPLISKENLIITVGDISTQALIKKLYKPTLAIIDNKVAREELPLKKRVKHDFFNRILKFENPAGTISRKLYRTIQRIYFSLTEENTLIILEGEEDLATLPCILFAPIDSHIFYGQPNEGLVHIIVDKYIKEKAQDIFNQFL